MDSKLGLMWSSMSWFVLVLSYLISFYNFSNFYFMCTDVLSACMSVSDDPGITDSCELPCGCWELNLGPLKDQWVFLTVESPLQSPGSTFNLIILETWSHYVTLAVLELTCLSSQLQTQDLLASASAGATSKVRKQPSGMISPVLPSQSISQDSNPAC